MEKTFEELIKDPFGNTPQIFSEEKVLQLLQKVREATSEEFCQAILGVTLPAETVMKIGKIVTATDRIKITDENRKGN